MCYTVNELAQLSGVSKRTLRYYDQIGLLPPERINPNGYRIYSQRQVDILQQILFYRELNFTLSQIKELVCSPNFDCEQALKEHLSSLENKKEQIVLLIENVKNTISNMRGETVMSNKEKFSGFKKMMVEENEGKYGTEIRDKYGNKMIDESNKKFANMSEIQWKSQEELSQKINTMLSELVNTNAPTSEKSLELAKLHKEWLTAFWPDGTYSKEAHMALAESYVSDERFSAYYDKITEGAAEFLRDAITAYCSK